MNGSQLHEEMGRRGFRLPIIFLTGYGDIPASVRAIKAGALDFLSKAARLVKGVSWRAAAHAEFNRLRLSVVLAENRLAGALSKVE